MFKSTSLRVIFAISWCIYVVNSASWPTRKRINSIYCHTCYLDLTAEIFNSTHECFVPQRPKYRMTMCRTNYCMAEITTIMGVLAGFVRRCDDECQDSCYERGVGIRKTVCSICCDDQKPPNRINSRNKAKGKFSSVVYDYYLCGTDKLTNIANHKSSGSLFMSVLASMFTVIAL